MKEIETKNTEYNETEKFGKKQNFAFKLFKLLLFLTIIMAIVVVCFVIFKSTGVWQKINSIEKIRKIVESGGIFSSLIFILLQILQTTILQIPAIVVTLAGTLIFGRWHAFFLSYIAVLIGSIIMFWLGRKAGRKLLNMFITEDKMNMWAERLSRGKYVFFLMMLFPLFPDDILCLVAGFTNMSFRYFFWTNVIARGVGIGCTVFFGSGAIIPFHGWGLIVWGIILIVVALLFYFSLKFKDKIDKFLNGFEKRKP